MLCALAGATFAAGRAGIDRPIRVGMFKGMGTTTQFWHTNHHTAQTVMGQILANPTGAELGDSLVVPSAGFTYYAMPVALNTGETAECSSNGCGPTQAQLDTIVAALDTLDVLVMNSNVNIGSRITNPVHREAFERFWATKGFVSVHATTENLGSWNRLDTIHGARFRGHPVEQNGTIRRDSVFANEPHWRYLNRGLFSNGTDTTFLEEWFYFHESGAAIRAVPHLKPTVVLNEASVANPGSQTPMGDHPMSWYRALPTGGRTFYTALGHRSQAWQTTRTFRRQLYNAILWTARYDSPALPVAVERGHARPFAHALRVTSRQGKISVEVNETEPHTVELSTTTGQRIALRRGGATPPTTHEFSTPKTGVYIVTVNTIRGRSVRLAAIGR